MINKFNKRFIAIPIITSILPGFYQSWEDLNEYELQKENYKTTFRKNETAVIGFAKGIAFGVTLTIFSPIVFPGIIISNVHTYYNEK